jgi:hypothetical protein
LPVGHLQKRQFAMHPYISIKKLFGFYFNLFGYLSAKICYICVLCVLKTRLSPIPNS